MNLFVSNLNLKISSLFVQPLYLLILNSEQWDLPTTIVKMLSIKFMLTFLKKLLSNNDLSEEFIFISSISSLIFIDENVLTVSSAILSFPITLIFLTISPSDKLADKKINIFDINNTFKKKLIIAIYTRLLIFLNEHNYLILIYH